MMRIVIAAMVPLLMLSACAADRGDTRSAARGALIGAAGGAVLAGVTGGDPLAGAAIGAAGGAAVGVITQDGKERRVYERTNGSQYWIDDRGQHHDVSRDRWNRDGRRDGRRR